jgi:hypothetical protein
LSAICTEPSIKFDLGRKCDLFRYSKAESPWRIDEFSHCDRKWQTAVDGDRQRKRNSRARATPNNTACRPRSRIRRLGSTGSTSDFGISVSLAISPTTSTLTAWIPRSDGKVSHQPQTSLASGAQHQTGGRSDRPLPWRACSAEMGRPRYVRPSYTQ